MPQSMDYYKQQAGDQVKAQYAQQLQDLQNKYNQSTQMAKDTGKQTQNNYNNQVLSRGLGRSSIATTGLAGIDNTTNKNLTNLATNYNQGVAGINTNKDSAISQLANSLYNNDYNREWQQQQAAQAQRNWEAQQAEQKRQFDAQQALALQQLQAQRTSSAAKASTPSRSSLRDQAASTLDKYINQGNYASAKAFLYNDQDNMVNDLGYDYWKKLENKLWDWQGSY